MNINGYSTGKADITIGDSIVTVNFPKTNYGSGLEEILNLSGSTVQLLNVDTLRTSIIQDPIGFDFTWVYHWENFITGEDLINVVQPLLRAWYNQYPIKLTPRIDVGERTYWVKLTNESVVTMLRAFNYVNGSPKGKYHKGVIISFVVQDTQTDPNWIIVPEPATTNAVVFDIQIWVQST